MNLIDTTKLLNEACKILKKQKTIAIDCEFIREKTYYPIPCLIQIGYPDEEKESRTQFNKEYVHYL